MIERTERGWGGHFISCHQCLFRRNTLLSHNNIKIVVSTVGLLRDNSGEYLTVGHNRYFETLAFHSDKNDERYHDANFTNQITFNSKWYIEIPDADDKANEMHENVVNEITERLKKGELL